MKPYSKKYLTLALAGVLAASIPVSAFATGEESDTKPGGENQPAVTDTTTNNEKTEAEKAKEEAEKAKKEAEKAKEEAQKAKEEADRLRKEKEAKEKKDKEEKDFYEEI